MGLREDLGVPQGGLQEALPFDAGLTRAPPAMYLGPQAVWAKGSQLFHPMIGPIANATVRVESKRL